MGIKVPSQGRKNRENGGLSIKDVVLAFFAVFDVLMVGNIWDKKGSIFGFLGVRRDPIFSSFFSFLIFLYSFYKYLCFINILLSLYMFFMSWSRRLKKDGKIVFFQGPQEGPFYEFLYDFL